MNAIAFPPSPMLADDVLPIAATVLSICGGTVVAIVAITLGHWRRVRQASYIARLKQIMIERGMSVEEIERVIATGPDEDSGSRKWGWVAHFRQRKTYC